MSTEGAIFEALSVGPFAGPGYVLLPQVRNCTGFGKAIRTADAVAVSVWPSKGIFAHGIEIKVSRADWKAELRDPSKAQAIAKYCRYWSIACLEHVVRDVAEVGVFGLIHVIDGKARVVKQPDAQEAEPWDHLFCASILRSAACASIPRFTLKDVFAKAFENGVEHGRSMANRECHFDREALHRYVIETEGKDGDA